MGKSTEFDDDNNPTVADSDPAKLLEAALQQMDGIIAEAGNTSVSSTGLGRAARARALELAQQLASSLQHAIPPPPRPDFTTSSAILRWLQQNNNSVALTKFGRVVSLKCSLMSDREFLTDNLKDDEDETAAAGRLPLALRSYLYSPIGGDSDSPDEATVRCTPWTEGAIEVRVDTSDSESSSSDDDDSEGDADYRTLTPSRRLDNSTRRDDDFKWMPPGEANGSGAIAHDGNHGSASLERRRRSGDREERDRKTRSSASSRPPQPPWRGRRSRGADGDPQRRWNTSERCAGAGAEPPPWWPVCWCHAPPPCCLHDRAWPSHPSLPTLSTPTRPYKSDAEDRVRRLEGDKESLQLQVQVLSEQISAQSEKMSDLERALMDARRRLEDAEQRLQKEMLQRSSLETQKLELLSKLSEVRLRAVERGVLDQPDTPVARPAPPRTPPANYGRQIERNSHMYSSLPRTPAITSDSRLAFAEKMEVLPRGSPSPSLREVRTRLGSGGVRLEGDDLARVSPRTLMKPKVDALWQTTDVRQWDAETTCGWLESLGLECYVAAARSWLNSNPDARGVIASASSHTIEKELAIKHPLHKKKIVLALADLMGGHGDALLTAAGALDAAWVLRWLEDVGLCGARAAAADAGLDARLLHRLAHAELHAQLRVPLALHAASLRRGIQVLRDNKFNPDTMIRRATENDSSVSADGSEDGTNTSEIARWSTHRVMQWLKEIDLAEYAPNLRGAGVHGGLMLLEPRFTAELLADLLNIPANKTLLRRHLTQRFNDLLGKEVIQQKRNAEQTLGYQPLTATTKYKIPKKSQSFSLKRKKSKDELDLGDLVCPLHDDGSGDNPTSPTMKVKSSVVASGVYLPRDVTRAH